MIVISNDIMEAFGDIIPGVEVHAEREVALIEGILEFRDLGALRGGGEDDKIEIGIRAGGAFDAGAVGPDGDAGKVTVQEGEQSFPLFLGDIKGGGHAQDFPVSV